MATYKKSISDVMACDRQNKFRRFLNEYFASIGKIQNVPKTKANYTNYFNTPTLNSIYLETTTCIVVVN